MKKYSILLLVAVFLFISFGLNSNAIAGKNESVLLALTATPNPKKLARIERIELDRDEVLITCQPILKNNPLFKGPCFEDFNGLVNVKTFVNNPKNVPLTYQYTVTSGRIIGEGANVTWNLNVRPGTYTITVAIKGKRGVSEETRTQKIIVRECDCPIICVPCPALSVSGGGEIKAGENVSFTLNMSNSPPDITYNWSVSQGEIIEGQGTTKIIVKTTPEMTGKIKATVEIDSKSYDLCEPCPRTAFEYAEIIK